MYLAEGLQQKWAPVLDHEDMPKIKDPYRKAVTAVLLENQEKAMAEQAAAEGAQAVEQRGVMAGDRAGGGAAVPTRGRRRTDEGGAHGREGGRDTRASGRRHAASRIASVGSRGETVPAARRGGAS